ncbi:MAG TPA: lysoplasmalogenase family protein, partial [Ottowia sp.]|nr:lysoplasmalogenase family protein [Ottowia sp.]
AAKPAPPTSAFALGAGLFMLSDSLLATNRFVQPLPLAPLWVLGSYFIAQLLIAACARPVSARGQSGT